MKLEACILVLLDLSPSTIAAVLRGLRVALMAALLVLLAGMCLFLNASMTRWPRIPRTLIVKHVQD
jgi:hypothetical protein